MAEGLVLLTKDGAVATLTLNRPEKLNALSPALLKEFDAAIDKVAADADTRVLVIRGAGRAFSAGYDLARSRDGTTVGSDRQRLQANLERWHHLRDLPKPVIAMVQGHCLAGATQLCICCDITFVADDATIGFPSIPAGAGLIGQMWTWLVGPSRAKYMSFLPGSQITGKEAEAFGWATLSYPRERLEQETYSYARRIAKVPPELLQIKKLSVNRTVDLQGFRAATMFGAEWDTIAHETEGVKVLQQSIKDKGLRATIDSFKGQ